MIKAIIFDADGMLIRQGLRFSEHLDKDYGIPADITRNFFYNEFQDCLVGKADLKKELGKHIEKWGWNGSIDELLNYWFKVEGNVDTEMISFIERLKKEGIQCYLATNQDKYRTEHFKSSMGFDKLFDKIFSASDIGFKKPEHQFFEYVMQSLPQDIAKDQISFWDDDEYNVSGAKKFGLQANLYKNLQDFKQNIFKNI